MNNFRSLQEGILANLLLVFVVVRKVNPVPWQPEIPEIWTGLGQLEEGKSVLWYRQVP